MGLLKIIQVLCYVVNKQFIAQQFFKPYYSQNKRSQAKCPPTCEMSVCGEYVYNMYVKNAIKGMTNSLPFPLTKPLPWSNTAWAFLDSLVRFKTHIINILSFF